MNETKKLITQIVKDYALLFKDEYKIFKQAMKMKKEALRDEFGKPEGSDYHRALLEMPETLHGMFVNKMTDEQMVWFKTKEGAFWFAREFPLFALPDKL